MSEPDTEPSLALNSALLSLPCDPPTNSTDMHSFSIIL